MNKYYIVYDKAFTSKTSAEVYCVRSGINLDKIVTTAEVETKEKYYLLKTQGSNRGVQYLTWLTSTQLDSSEWIEELERLKSNEYLTRYVSLEEISKSEYEKHGSNK